MNRKIKFRGKRKNSNKFVYGDLLQNTCGDSWIGVHSIDWNDKLPPSNYPNIIDVEEETVGQFIGLLDKDGKEIYEGDKVIMVSNNNFCKGEIIWSDIFCSFILIRKNGYIENNLSKANTTIFKIIGNIYDI